MRIFVAGGSGAIGLPLVRALVAAGHDVTALTRTPGKQLNLRAIGATAAVADALDSKALTAAVVAARPTHVIHQLTALPKEGPRRARDLVATNRLRIDGTRHLLDAAIAAGARRFIVGSFAPLADPAPGLPDALRDAADAIAAMESQVVDASRANRIDGLVLRYGLFYGPENEGTQQMIAMVRRRMLPAIRGDRGRLPWIRVDDAVTATVAALDRGAAGASYEIVDDRAVNVTDFVRTIAECTGSPDPFAAPAWLLRLMAPYLAAVASLDVPRSNAAARHDLGWRPAFPTIRDGLSDLLHRAA